MTHSRLECAWEWNSTGFRVFHGILMGIRIRMLLIMERDENGINVMGMGVAF